MYNNIYEYCGYDNLSSIDTDMMYYNKYNDQYICNTDEEFELFANKDITNVPMKRYFFYKEKYNIYFAEYLMSVDKEFAENVYKLYNLSKYDTANKSSSINNFFYDDIQFIDANSYSSSSCNYNYNNYSYNSRLYANSGHYNNFGLEESILNQCLFEELEKNIDLKKFFSASFNKYVIMKEAERDHKIETILKSAELAPITEQLTANAINFSSIEV